VVYEGPEKFMSDYHIIDRRENPKGKNLPNRQKFLKRVRKHVKEQVRDSMGRKRITDDSGESISVPIDGIGEPSFDYDRSTGEWERILPGNREFVKGDRIKKPPNGGSGKGNQGSNGGGGEDEFRFTITREEYLDLVFEDLELPDMVKRSEKAAVTWHNKRAGFKTDGNPSQLDLVRSMKNSIGRRLAVKRPLEREIAELEEQLELDPANQTLIDQLESLRSRNRSIPWVDPMDLRYRRWDQVPVPNSQAVMFCLMDVSGSMGKGEKEIAKRFYLLLYLFLQRKYEKVEIVFVRHTENAKEVDEHEFFNSQESGGTVVSSGLEMVGDIIQKRYPLDAWNIYITQASDGDNYSNDNRICTELLRNLLPKVQYYVYAEVREGDNHTQLFNIGNNQSGLWEIMDQLMPEFEQLTSVRIPSVDQVVPIFREVFAKENANG
jgi:uncharacterized protein